MDRASQRQRLETTDGEIFDQAKTHNPSVPFKKARGLGTSSQMRIVMCTNEENGLITAPTLAA